MKALPRRRRAGIGVALGLALIAVACSSGEPAVTTSTIRVTTSAAPTTTASTSTTVAPTTIAGSAEVTTTGGPPELAALVGDLYGWLAGVDPSPPSAPAALIGHLSSAVERRLIEDTLTATSASLPTGEQVAVVTGSEGDVILAASDPDGFWSIEGGVIDGHDGWFGDSTRLVLVLGSDARPGENQQRFRADSIHVVALRPDGSAGTIVGFPRDSWVESPAGRMKFTNVMAGRGPEIMLETTTNLTDLPIEGYVVTGFRGFTDLVDAFGGIDIELPSRIRSGIDGWRNFAAGWLHLDGADTLKLARIRKTLPDGDFGRSRNHGRIMRAALATTQENDPSGLIDTIASLHEHAWTDLDAGALLTMFGAAYMTPLDELENMVLPGSVGNAGAASVVFLGSGAEDVFRDVADGVLDADDEAEGSNTEDGGADA